MDIIVDDINSKLDAVNNDNSNFIVVNDRYLFVVDYNDNSRLLVVVNNNC